MANSLDSFTDSTPDHSGVNGLPSNFPIPGKLGSIIQLYHKLLGALPGLPQGSPSTGVMQQPDLPHSSKELFFGLLPLLLHQSLRNGVLGGVDQGVEGPYRPGQAPPPSVDTPNNPFQDPSPQQLERARQLIARQNNPVDGQQATTGMALRSNPLDPSELARTILARWKEGHLGN